MPLGNLLIQSSSTASAGGKERFLRHLLAHFKRVWKIRAITTLSDKDWSEIKAFIAEYPEAKHQLCFWHALRAIKKRLAILRRMPMANLNGLTSTSFPLASRRRLIQG
jgi:hypothetical protein